MKYYSVAEIEMTDQAWAGRKLALHQCHFSSLNESGVDLAVFGS